MQAQAWEGGATCRGTRRLRTRETTSITYLGSLPVAFAISAVPPAPVESG